MSNLRSYSESRGNVVKAIRENSANATWIDASTSFWFSLDADTRLKYDPTLGPYQRAMAKPNRSRPIFR